MDEEIGSQIDATKIFVEAKFKRRIWGNRLR